VGIPAGVAARNTKRMLQLRQTLVLSGGGGSAHKCAGTCRLLLQGLQRLITVHLAALQAGINHKAWHAPP
jgi:hypothetical protein